MVVVSYSGKEINAKLVYYGPGLCGKTTNLEAIYEAVPDTSRGKMVSMKTQSDRTLFYDLLPLDLGEIMGFKTRFLLYTVPGQVFYNATRKLVLKGADAIVFVADSEVGKMEENRESLANLRTNLAEYNISIDTIPWVLQYNKRDLANVYSLDELNAELNPGNKVPFFEAVARDGKGVFETFRGISHLLMEKVTKDLRRAPSGTNRPSAPVEPVAEAPVSREVSRPALPSAPPVAPTHAIQHEAQSTPASIVGGDETRIDYGREIELPGTIPVAQALPASLPVAPRSAATVEAQVPVSVASSSPALPASAPVSAAVAHAPAPVVHAPYAQPVAENAPQARNASAPGSPRPTPVIVPVKLAKGGTYEIVIRLEVEDD